MRAPPSRRGDLSSFRRRLLAFPYGVFRNSCGRTSHEDRRVEIEAAENAEPGVAADGVPQQDAAEESTTTSAAARSRFLIPDS